MQSNCFSTRKHLISRIALPFCCLLLLTGECIGQAAPDSAASVTRAAGEGYAAGTLHRWLFGSLWRDLWTTPVKVPVLDLESFAGGLAPLRRGGGQQTASLRLRGADGVEYKFRSINKDPVAVLDEKLRETFVADVVQDLISTANPYGAMVTVPILNSVGILNAQPLLFVMPDSPKLGIFREEFGGMMGMLEVHPDEGEDDENGFGGSDKIVGTYSLFEKLNHDTEDRVDAVAFLKARILDIFMGDWDRHTDQWRWARFEEGDIDWWQPIPRDRDQAFSRYNGLIPWIATIMIPQLESCDADYPRLKYLTYSGRFLDRRFLSGLSWPVYDSLVQVIQPKLTDSLLLAAVHRMPDEVRETEAQVLFAVLQSRRETLPEAVRDYYEVLAAETDMHCSDEAEMVEVTRHPGGDVSVFARTLGKSGRPPIFQRTFHPDETKEIRIYMRDGDDIAVVRGVQDGSITVRVIGDGGEDRYVDSSLVRGPFLGLLPFIRTTRTATYFYDHGDESMFSINTSTAIDRTRMPEPQTDLERYEPEPPDWGWDVLPALIGAYHADLGVLIGGGPIYTRYGFRDDPYDHKLSLMAGFAPMTFLGKAEFIGDFRSLLPGSTVLITAGASGFEVLNFFGFGNETANLDDADYTYAVKQTQVYFNPRVMIPVSDPLTLDLGLGIRHVRNDLDDEKLYLQEAEPYGIDPTNLAHVEVGLTYDTRDEPAWPSSGLYARVLAKHFPSLFELLSRFETVEGELRSYLSADILTDMTLALRAGGQYNHGKHPFFEAAFLGGKGSARGYELNRFAGDAAVFGSAEWRAYLFDMRIIFPSEFGVFAFAETGRVFLEEEESDVWHPSWGGGIWLAPVERAFTFSASAGVSDEGLRIDVAAGFAF